MTAPPYHRSTGRDLWWGLALVVLAAAVRYPRLHDSLWLDEMATLVDFVQQPWRLVLAGRAGEYIPNNHVGFTVLAKLIYPTGTPAPVEAMLRLPAWAAGSLLPVAVAWPLRRRSPLAALAVGVAVAVNPWLVVLGSEARGYSLMLLSGLVATHLLPRAGDRWPRATGYAIWLAGAIYTVPLAVLLVPAHAAAVLAMGRGALRRWAVGAGAGLALTVALYLPMVGGLRSYYRHPYPPTLTYAGMLDGLPRHVLTGDRLPRRGVDPLLPPGRDRPVDPAESAVFWAVPVLAIVVGSVVGWQRFPDARPLLATLGTATLLGLLLPLAITSAAEVRFVTWAAPWFCLSLVLLLAAAADTRTAFGRTAAVAGVAVWVAQSAVWDARQLPNQQVRQAMQWAERHCPPGHAIVVAYVGSTEAVDCYAGDCTTHGVLPAPTVPVFAKVIAEARQTTGHRPWVVLLFEQMARDREPAGFWLPLATGFDRVARLDGRVVPVAVFAPREPDGPDPPVARAEGGEVP